MNAPLLEPYLRGLREGGHDPASARMGGLLDIIVADDPEQATERILPHLAHQANTYRRGKHPDNRDAKKIAAVLSAVAGDLEA